MDSSIEQKSCSTCKVPKPVSEFYSSRYNSDGLRSQCKPCHKSYQSTTQGKIRHGIYRAANRSKIRARARLRSPEKTRQERLKFKYGLSTTEYNQILSEQQGCCAICGRLPGNRSLAVDHDHATGQVRGLLCGRCNVALGLLGDTVGTLIKAMRYLSKTV